ncbi:MAG: hypothetical protein RBT80_17420 [Candidatus Vecturithrix sp.]|nr:hypothetical protein [Candidatus Vecturithrix sp.]
MVVCLGILVNEAETTERTIQLSYFQNQVLLDPVTSFELLGEGSDYQALPVQGDIRAQRLLVDEIFRTLPSVWQIRVPAKVAPGSLRVRSHLSFSKPLVVCQMTNSPIM